MKRFEHIILASDMDGTFLSKTREGRTRNREAIEYFKAQGGHFTFATGRNPQQVLDVVPDTAELLNFPAVTCNGSCLYDFTCDREISRYLLEYEAVRDLVYWLQREDPTVGVRGAAQDRFWFNCMDNPYIREDYESLGTRRRTVAPVETWQEAPLYKLAIRAEEETLERLRAPMTEAFRGRLEITQSGKTLIDVQHAGRTKAILLRELVERSEIEHPLLCVVGDYDNDLEMLQIADLPCCPANAEECVKRICRLEVCHCNEGAIAEVIEYLDRTHGEKENDQNP